MIHRTTNNVVPTREKPCVEIPDKKLDIILPISKSCGRCSPGRSLPRFHSILVVLALVTRTPTTSTMKPFPFTTSLLTLACTVLLTPLNAASNDCDTSLLYDEAAEAAGAPDVIFSNLDSLPGARFNNIDTLAARPVAGRQAGPDQTEEWTAVRFIPETDVQVKVLEAAIGYISGDKLVNLGIYTNDDTLNTVGDPLPGAEGATRKIPDLGDCCQLAKVNLEGEGVTLTGGTIYWLVASPDDVHGPTFHGAWQVSNFGKSADRPPPFMWGPQPGKWPAARILGTRLQSKTPVADISVAASTYNKSDSNGDVVIFSNLGPNASERYLSAATAEVIGNDVAFQPEVWSAFPFTPKADVHATTLAAAIGWVQGTREVELSLYTDDDGVPGAPLPGGQGSTTDIPDTGDCCKLAKVSLPGLGVALQGGVQVWLVASPDNMNAPDFLGFWQTSSVAFAAYQEPELLTNWTSFTGGWLATEVRGTKP